MKITTKAARSLKSASAMVFSVGVGQLEIRRGGAERQHGGWCQGHAGNVARRDNFRKPHSFDITAARARCSHHDRQNEHRPAVLIQPALQLKNGVVVQPARDQAFILEHQLPCKKLGLRIFIGDAVA